MVGKLYFIFGLLIAGVKRVLCDPEPESLDNSLDLSGVSDTVASSLSIFIFILICSCVLQFVTSKVNDKTPISLVLFVFGMLVYGILMSFSEESLPSGIITWLASVRRIDNSILYFIALPILLYEATQKIDWYSFCNFMPAGTGLAVIGVLLQVGILGVVFHYALGSGERWSYSISFLLASILSSTDPVAVLSILGDAKTQNKLITIFNGESLINDGTSVLLFQFFYLLTTNQSSSFWYYVGLFIKLLILSPLVGVLCGTMVIVWISFFRKWPVVKSLTSIIMGYLLYFCAEYYLNISGPLSIVVYGIFVRAYGPMSFDSEALEKHRVMVEGLACISDYVVFAVSGILTVGMLRSQFLIRRIGVKILKLFVVYLFLNVARTIMLISFKPLLKYTGYQVNYKELILLIWGGLRGAMVLVLGLRLENDPRIHHSISDLLSFYISGSTMIILIVQGFSFDALYRRLNPYPMNPLRRAYLEKTMRLAEDVYLEKMFELKTHWLFKSSDIVEKANMLVPSLDALHWDKMGSLAASGTGVRLENLVVIDELNEAEGQEEEVEVEENIYLFKSEVGFNNNTYIRVVGKPKEESDPSEQLEEGPEWTIKTGLSYTSGMDEEDSEDTMALPPRSSTNTQDNTMKEERLNLVIHKASERSLCTDPNIFFSKDELYIIIFNALLYTYNEMYRDNYIHGKSFLTLQNTLNLSLDFAINKLNYRTLNIWSNIKKEYLSEGDNFDMNENNVYHKNLDKMNGFEFEWFVLKISLEEIMNRKLNFIKVSTFSFILDVLLGYIEAHEKLSKLLSANSHVINQELTKSYLIQINNAKRYVFNIKNKTNINFYRCLLGKIAAKMINLKKGVIEEFYSDGMLLSEDRDQIINMLDYELYTISSKINYVKIVKFLAKKMYYLVTFNKRMHTATNTI